MTNRSFSFVRIHTRIDLRSHTAASYPCISNIASCMLSSIRYTRQYCRRKAERFHVLPIQALIPPISAAPRPPGLFLLLQAST